MWLSFVLACTLCVGLLYLPGFLLIFSMGRLRWYDVVACAPLVGVGCYAVIAILIHWAGITASAAVIVLPVLVAGAILALLRLVISNKKGLVSAGINEVAGASGAFRSSLVTTAAYLFAGVLVVGFVFVKNLDGAASVFQAYDNGSHLNAIATSLNSGNYSSFLGNFYSEPNAVSPFLETAAAFYPRAWHELVALVVEVMGIPISLGINAVDTVLLGIVYPLGMHSLLRRLFDGNNRFVLLGAILCLAFPAGVLDFVTFGPLYPMLLAYVLAPAAMASFIELTSPDLSPLSSRIGWGVLFVAGCVSIALSQPSGIFLMAVLLAPLVVFRSRQICTKHTQNKKVRAAVPVLVSLLIACVWYGLYRFPPFESLVSFNWPATDGISQAVADVLLFSMSSHSAQPIVATFVLLGILVAVRDSNRRVFIIPYLFTGLTYVLCVATEGDFKHLLGGFWYTDPHRVAVNVSLAAIPLAVFGASFLFDLAQFACSSIHERLPESLSGRTGAQVTLVALLLGAFCPSINIRGYYPADTAFGFIGGQIAEQNDLEGEHVLDKDEMEFVEDALAVIPEGSLIINSPNDGSGYIYALYGANIYYRSFELPPLEREKEESVEIRRSLDSISTNDNVAEAVSKIGAQYVLLLDQGAAEELEQLDSVSAYGYESSEPERKFFWSYYPNQWAGIEGITDETPGFEVVLAKGDMRLYRIVV